MFGNFVNDNRIENQMLLIPLSFVTTICAAQLGGMPTPKLGSKFGLGTWSLWMVAVVMQWLSIFIGLVMVCQSYTAMATQSRACMLPFHEGSDLARLNVVAALTFFMQPVILVPLLLMYFFVAACLPNSYVKVCPRRKE